MADSYNASVPTLSNGPAIGCLLINYTSDQTWTGVARGIYLTTAGTLKVDFANGTTATLSALAAGTIYSLAITKIYQTGSATAAGYILF